MIKNVFLFLVIILFNLSAFSQYNITYHQDAGNPCPLNTSIDDDISGWMFKFFYLPLQTTNRPLWTASYTDIPSSMDFYFNGKKVSKIYISLNGIIVFDTITTLYPPNLNQVLPTDSLPDNSIACFWDQFTVNPPLSSNDQVYTKSFSSPNINDQFWIKWYSYEYGNYTDYVYFSCVLEEGTNNIYFVDHDCSTAGNTLSTTVGVQFDSASSVQVVGSPNINLGSTLYEQGGKYHSNNDYYKFEFLGNIKAHPKDTIFCGNNSVHMCVKSFYNNAVYQWQKCENNNWSNVLNSSIYSGETNDTLFINTNSNLSGNKYRCIVNCGGYIDTSSAALLTIDPTSQNYNLGNDTSGCCGSNLTLDAGSGYISYLWSTGDAGQYCIADSLSGYYTVTVTNNNGCQSSDSVYVTVYPLPNISSMTGLGQVIELDTVIYEVPITPSSTYTWNIPTNGIILSGNGTNQVSVLAGLYGNMEIKVYETSVHGCTGDTYTKNVNIGHIGIKDDQIIHNDTEILIYPNPAMDKIFFSSKDAIDWVKIYQTDGKFIKEINFNYKTQFEQIDISSLNKGLYILSFKIKDEINSVILSKIN
jgi:hypothetical protein